jgi:hypothetical protein
MERNLGLPDSMKEVPSGTQAGTEPAQLLRAAWILIKAHGFDLYRQKRHDLN